MASVDKLRWRVRLLRTALASRTPDANWLDILSGLKPNRVEEWNWKLRFIHKKVSGYFPDASWPEVARWLRQADLRGCGALSALAQVVEMDSASGMILYRTPQGQFWGRPQDRGELGGLAFEHLVLLMYERGTVVLRQGDIVIDGGAHLGTFTRLALARGAQRVIAFEPDRSNLRCLNRTFARELASGQVTLIPAALWREPGIVEFQEQGGPGGRVCSQHQAAESVRIPANSIDEVRRQLRLDRVDFIKMDIEGAERQALEGGRETIALYKPRMAICTYHLPDDVPVIQRSVRNIRADYRVRMRQKQQAYFF